MAVCQRCGDLLPDGKANRKLCETCRATASTRMYDAVCAVCGSAPAMMNGTCAACVRAGHLVFIEYPAERW